MFAHSFNTEHLGDFHLHIFRTLSFSLLSHWTHSVNTCFTKIHQPSSHSNSATCKTSHMCCTSAKCLHTETEFMKMFAEYIIYRGGGGTRALTDEFLCNCHRSQGILGIYFCVNFLFFQKWDTKEYAMMQNKKKEGFWSKLLHYSPFHICFCHDISIRHHSLYVRADTVACTLRSRLPRTMCDWVRS